MASEMQKEPSTGSSLGQGDSGSRPEAGRASDHAKERAQGIWNDAKEGVRSAVNERQHATANEIQDFADALRGAGGSVDSTSPSARMAESAAEALERLSRTLRSKEVGTLVQDLESLARRQPALFLGAAVAAGFLAVRFLKSGGEHGETSASESAPDAGSTGRAVH